MTYIQSSFAIQSKQHYIVAYTNTMFTLYQWFPTGGLQRQSGSRRSGCGVANNNLNSLLKAQILELSVSTFCVTSAKLKHTQIFVKFTFISIIILIWFLLYQGWPLANQSGTKSHISYCVTTKSHIIHMGTYEHQPSYP